MSDSPDPVIALVLSELRKAANEGESMTFWSIPRALGAGGFCCVKVESWRDNAIGECRISMETCQSWGYAGLCSTCCAGSAVILRAHSPPPVCSAGLETAHVTTFKTASLE